MNSENWFSFSLMKSLFLIFLNASVKNLAFFWPTLWGAPYKNLLIFFDFLWLVKMRGELLFIVVQKLSNKLFPGQFWPCLASISVASGMALSSDFLFCGPNFRPLVLRYELVWRRGGEIRFEWVFSAVSTVENHLHQFKNNQLKCKYFTTVGIHSIN